MPSSFPENFHVIAKMLMDLQPKSVLDIGPGHGKYGLACREYLHDVQKVDALEIFPPYVTPRLKAIYDTVYVDNALDFDYPQYDVYLIIDVLEHWDKESGHKLLSHLTKLGKVIISTPRAPGPQGAVNGNEWERHVSEWGGEDFERYPFKHMHNEISFIYLLG